jgi:hypothetical protein
MLSAEGGWEPKLPVCEADLIAYDALLALQFRKPGLRHAAILVNDFLRGGILLDQVRVLVVAALSAAIDDP